MYPNDAITVHHELVGVSSYTINNSTEVKYILGISIQQGNTASTSKLQCGTTDVALNYAQNLSFNHLSYRCNESIIISKTGQDSASFIVTYVPRDITLVGTTSASFSYVDIASSSALAIGLSNQFWYFMIFALIVVAYIGWKFGIWLYRR